MIVFCKKIYEIVTQHFELKLQVKYSSDKTSGVLKLLKGGVDFRSQTYSRLHTLLITNEPKFDDFDEYAKAGDVQFRF